MRRGIAARNVISGALTIVQISFSRESRDLIIMDKRGGELGHPESFRYDFSEDSYKRVLVLLRIVPKGTCLRVTLISSLRLAPDIFEILRAEMTKSV